MSLRRAAATLAPGVSLALSLALLAGCSGDAGPPDGLEAPRSATEPADGGAAGGGATRGGTGAGGDAPGGQGRRPRAGSTGRVRGVVPAPPAKKIRGWGNIPPEPPQWGKATPP